MLMALLALLLISLDDCIFFFHLYLFYLCKTHLIVFLDEICYIHIIKLCCVHCFNKHVSNHVIIFYYEFTRLDLINDIFFFFCDFLLLKKHFCSFCIFLYLVFLCDHLFLKHFIFLYLCIFSHLYVSVFTHCDYVLLKFLKF